MGMLDEVKKQNEEKNAKWQKEYDQMHKDFREEDKLISDTLQSYIPLVEEFCKESGFKYALRYDCFPGRGEKGHFIRISGGKQAYLMITAHLEKSRFWGGRKMVTAVYTTTYSFHDFAKSQKNASEEWVKSWLVEFYKHHDRYK